MALLLMVSKRLWIITAVLALAGASAGFLAGRHAPQDHSASATILISPLEGNAFYPSSRGEQLINLTTEAQVLKSDAVADLVIKKTGASSTPAALLQGLSTTVPPNTQLIGISYEHRNQATALERAQAFADSFLDFRSIRARSYLDGQISGIQTETKQLTEQMAELTKQLKASGTSAVDKTVLEARLNAGAGQLAALGARESALATTRIDPGQVITPASLDQAPIIGTPEIFGIAGLVGGLAVAAALMLFSARGRRVVKRKGELEVFSANCKALTPTSMPVSRGASSATRSRSAQAADFVAFRSQLLALMQGGGKRVALVASAGPQSESPRCAAALAEALSTARIQTLILDTTGKTDIHGGPATGAPGLGEILDGTMTLFDVAQAVGPFLKILGPGKFSRDSEEGIPTQRLNELLADFKRTVDVVVVLTNDLSQPLAQSLVASVPTVLMEVELGSTRHVEIRAAQYICSGLAAELIGLLVIDPSRPHRSPLLPSEPAPDKFPMEETASGNGVFHGKNA
ncbi:Wzz/FepE/Etk N-terminal domain-containing protein [Paeniglutamicibacter cryotolerans]|uniref:Mrp family chromosome partitioning ATPase n=1 Tax=Paeniglutamicibacter cryotolerans TaxID=670079 RepID=A0A839QJG8_9MICC|nr:Wzz/FepE/Etk N-terminal domain-containing protein [Paeniglutamicibacter cryotolerans]MBB2995990.1 Mrp family chromosome partitioning ATPase [Paeniglutamicibacter cryotolerans]